MAKAESDSTSHEMGNMASAHANIKTETSNVAVGEPGSETSSRRDYVDNDQLARVGKKQVLRRNFGFMSILGFSCTILITWEGSTVLFAQGLFNGGTSAIVYSFILVWISNLSVFTTMSELLSMAPTAGGQYHWVAMLAPRSCAKFMSYLTGWLTVGGWQGSVASSSLLTGTMIQGLIGLNWPEYDPKLWQGTLLFWAVILFAVFINTLVSSALPKFEGLILILHVLGFFAILIPLVTMADHAPASEIFSGIEDPSEWGSKGVAFLVGMMGNVFAFVGTDAAFHMAEETVNPGVVVPRSILLSIIINGSCGFAMIIAMVFCMGGMDFIEEASKTVPGTLRFLFMPIFQKATGSTAGASVMSAIIIILGACATVGMLASTSRVFWSFARDRGLPGWKLLSRVDSRTTVPVWAVIMTTVISVLLSLINIGSAVAFQSITSLSISCLYLSYLIAGTLLLYRRCTKGFAMPDPNGLPALANTAGAELLWGPFRVPGVLGIINNAYAISYLAVIIVFSFFPPNPAGPMLPLEAVNWSPLVTGSVVIFSVVYYLVWARREYNGPIVEI